MKKVLLCLLGILGGVLDLRGDPIALTAALVDIPSESRDEARIAEAAREFLRG